MRVAIAPHGFAFGYHRQPWWNWLVGTAFFCGGVGAGLFLISQTTGETLGAVLGYLIVIAGKNGAHLLYLGRPWRFWRAALRPDRSWIARGIWATAIFGLAGFVSLVPRVFAVSGVPAWTVTGASWLAGLSALFIMFYDGLLMRQSPAIPFWHTAVLPVLVLMYAALGGTTLSLALTGLFGVEHASTRLLTRVEQVLVVANLILLAVYLLRMSRWAPAARETARLLVRGRYARAFVGLVLVVGLVATLLLSLAENQVGSAWLLLVIAGCELTGDFTFLMVLLKSALFAPLTAPAHAYAR